MSSTDKGKIYKSLALILTVAALTRFIDLGHKTFWFDEGMTVSIVRGASEYFLPPGYFAIVGLVTGSLGESEYVYRLASAVFGWLTVLLTYLLALQIFKNRSSRYKLALFAGLITAISPYMIAVSQENRTYGLVAFVAASSTYLLLRALEFEGKRSWKWWLLYITVLSYGCYSHIFAFTLLLSANCYILWMKALKEMRFQYWRYLLVQALIFLIYLPQLVITLSQVSVRSYTLIQNFQNLGPKYYLIGLLRTLYRYSVGYIFDAPGTRFFDMLQTDPVMAVLGLFGILVTLAAVFFTIWGLIKIYRIKRDRNLLIFGVAFVLLLLVASLTFDDALPRQLAHIAPFFFIILIAGIGSLESRLQYMAYVLILAGNLILYIPYVSADTFPFSTLRWKYIAEYLNERVGENEMVFVNAGTRDGYYTLKYYGCQCELKFPGRKHMIEDMPVKYYYDEHGKIRTKTDSMLAEEFFRDYGYRRIWFINYDYSTSDLIANLNADKAEGDFGAGIEILVVDNSF
jgi:uncharacterized membrane protein